MGLMGLNLLSCFSHHFLVIVFLLAFFQFWRILVISVDISIPIPIHIYIPIGFGLNKIEIRGEIDF